MVYYLQNVLSQILSKTRVSRGWGGGGVCVCVCVWGGGKKTKMDYCMWRLFMK
jgi:hypothetical protein